MSEVTTTRRIRLAALGFPATAVTRGDSTTITADVSQADLDAAVTAAPDDTSDTTFTTLRDRARNALDNNRTFLGITSPTAAQNAAQVRALTRQNQALIRLVLGLLDSTE